MKKRLVLLALLLFAVCFFACYQPIEGCLDTDAVNYNVTADDPCPDCCTYPALSIALLHVVETPEDTVAMRYGIYYPASNGDSFLLDRVRFFISNVRLVRDDGTEAAVLDTLRLTFLSGMARTLADNFAKMDREFFQARRLGTVRLEGGFTKVRFTLGLEEYLHQDSILSGLPTRHPLESASDTIIYETGFGFIPNLVVVRYDTAVVKDSLAFRFFDPVPIELPLPKTFQATKGFHTKLTLKTNYTAWFAGVDFRNDTPPTIQQKISDNLPNVFSVTEIKHE